MQHLRTDCILSTPNSAVDPISTDFKMLFGRNSQSRHTTDTDTSRDDELSLHDDDVDDDDEECDKGFNNDGGRVGEVSELRMK